MASEPKVLKGYVKTENMILLVLLALVAGFIGGVAFGVYRSGDQTPATSDANVAARPLPAKDSEAIAALVSQTRANPSDTKAWTQLGHLYFDSGRHAEAIEAYEKSLSLDANRPDVWTDLGVMYRRNGQPRKAVDAFDRALSLNASHQIALFNKGIVLMHDLKDTKAALEAWESLLQINPQAQTPNGQKVKDMVDALKKNASS